MKHAYGGGVPMGSDLPPAPGATKAPRFAVWALKDPNAGNLDPSALATYYVRALEIPTPRWSFLRAIRNQLPPNEKMPLVIQERAWSSPIWYAPAP